MKPAAVERALIFGCEGEQLVGILHAPQTPEAPTDLGIVIIVGGPQYRAGSHRQFVSLARALSEAGYPVLRFDYRGMGDSSGGMRDFERVSDDIGAAIDALQLHLPSVGRVVLWGLCDGASAALLYCDDKKDERIAGLCVLNPWIRSEASLARTHLKHYYVQRLLQPAFWGKLASGKVAMQALPELVQKVRVAAGKPLSTAQPELPIEPFQQRMARGWARCNAILLVLSGNDYTAKEFIAHALADDVWSDLLQHSNLQRHEMPNADHTFSDAASSTSVERMTVEWLGTLTSMRRGVASSQRQGASH
jgi:exosortase A-associated hydrolase 1